MVRKVSEILQDNDVARKLYEQEQQETRKQPNLAKTALAGTVSGLVSTAPSVLGAISSLPEIGYHSLRGLFNKDYPTKDKVLNTLADSKLLKLGGYLDEKTKEAFGIDDITNLDKEHQAALMAGDFAPIIATGGSYGLIKAGQKVLNKTVKNATKKALAKGLTDKAKKDFIKKRAFIADTAMGFMTPGVQISKNSGKLGKLFQVGIQTAPSVGMNEYIQAKNKNEGLFGDYSDSEDPERVVLIKDKRKFKNKDEIPEKLKDNIVEYTITPKQEEESHTIRNLLAGTAAVGAAITGAARYTNAGKKLVNDVLKSATDINPNFDNMSTGEKLYTTISNQYGFLDKQIKNHDVRSEDINRYYMDKKVYTQNAWTRGTIGDDIQLNSLPEKTQIKMEELRNTNPQLYDEFEDFMELARQVQHESNAFNIGKDNYISTEEFLVTHNKDLMNLSGLYEDQPMFELFKKLDSTYKNLINNPNIRSIFDDLTNINKGLLNYKLKRGALTTQGYNNVIKNRTLFGQLLYKPGIEDMGEFGYIDRIKNSLFKSSAKTNRDLDYIENLTPRGKENSVHKAAKFLDVFEDSFKRNIMDVEKNYAIKNYLTNSAEILTNKVNNAINDFKVEIEDPYIEKVNMLQSQITEANINRNVTDYNKYTDDLIKLRKEFAKELKKTRQDITSMMHIRKLGERSLYNTVPDTLTKTYNIADNINKSNSIMGRSIAKYFNKSTPTAYSHMSKSSPRNGVISYIDGDKQVYVKMDPHYARALVYDPIISNPFTRMFYTSKNFLQSTITGKYAPWFAIRANLMTTNENMLAVSTIGKKLGLNNINIRGYLKEFSKNYKAMHSKYVADALANELQRKIAKINSQFDITDTEKAQVVNYQTQLNDLLNTKVSDQEAIINNLYRGGAISSKPINITDEQSYTLSKNFKLTNKIKLQLEKLYGFNGAEKAGNMLNLFVGMLRENPSLSLYTYIGKELKKQRGLNELNQDVLNEMSKIINTHVANNVLRGSEEGVTGGASRFIRNYMPYGNILINSITPKIVASGVGKGIKNVKQLSKDLLDADVRYIDVLKEMQDIAKQAGSNSYIRALFFVSFLPATIQYVWNHMNQDNIDSYYNNSNYNKASRIILSNFFGKGKHLTIPLDQEVALSNAMVYSFWDNVLGMSKYNENDPAFNKNKILLEALGRSVGLDFQPIKVIANLSGYNFSLDPFNDQRGIGALPKNKLNNDLSETAYENGIANQQITALTNTLFGQLGSAFLSAAEEGKVGLRSNTAFNDVISSFIDKTFGTIGLVQTDATRNMSLSNDTIKAVYEKRDVIKKISLIKDKNPQQQQIYDLIKMYNRNRVQAIKDQISLLRKDIDHVRANSKTIDNKTQSYYSTKTNINELTQQLQKLYKLEYEEYNKLDNLLQQLYGKNINIETFMKQFYIGE